MNMCKNIKCNGILYEYNINGYCSTCNRQRKKCKFCKEEHFRQGLTCSNECTQGQKRITCMTNFGTSHNLSKNSVFREKMKDKLLENEGIVNVFQRDTVKDKIKKTMLNTFGVDNPSKLEDIKKKKKETMIKNYGVDSMMRHPILKYEIAYKGKQSLLKLHQDPEKSKELLNRIKSTIFKKYGYPYLAQVPEFIKANAILIRKTNEANGLWLPLDQIDDFQYYKRKVIQFTKRSIKKYGDTKFGKLWKNTNDFTKTTIDHKYSVKAGFQNNILPEIIGSIINLQILSQSENSRKRTKCDHSIDELYLKFSLFKNENKID